MSLERFECEPRGHPRATSISQMSDVLVRGSEKDLRVCRPPHQYPLVMWLHKALQVTCGGGEPPGHTTGKGTEMKRLLTILAVVALTSATLFTSPPCIRPGRRFTTRQGVERLHRARHAELAGRGSHRHERHVGPALAGRQQRCPARAPAARRRSDRRIDEAPAAPGSAGSRSGELEGRHVWSFDHADLVEDPGRPQPGW